MNIHCRFEGCNCCALIGWRPNTQHTHTHTHTQSLISTLINREKQISSHRSGGRSPLLLIALLFFASHSSCSQLCADSLEWDYLLWFAYAHYCAIGPGKIEWRINGYAPLRMEQFSAWHSKGVRYLKKKNTPVKPPGSVKGALKREFKRSDCHSASCALWWQVNKVTDVPVLLPPGLYKGWALLGLWRNLLFFFHGNTFTSIHSCSFVLLWLVMLDNWLYYHEVSTKCHRTNGVESISNVYQLKHCQDMYPNKQLIEQSGMRPKKCSLLQVSIQLEACDALGRLVYDIP